MEFLDAEAVLARRATENAQLRRSLAEIDSWHPLVRALFPRGHRRKLEDARRQLAKSEAEEADLRAQIAEHAAEVTDAQ